jgi:hypothetical protein
MNIVAHAYSAGYRSKAYIMAQALSGLPAVAEHSAREEVESTEYLFLLIVVILIVIRVAVFVEGTRFSSSISQSRLLSKISHFMFSIPYT